MILGQITRPLNGRLTHEPLPPTYESLRKASHAPAGMCCPNCGEFMAEREGNEMCKPCVKMLRDERRERADWN